MSKGSKETYESDYDEKNDNSFAEEKHQEAKAQKLSNDELIEKVQEYFYTNEELAKSFENFVKEKAHLIDRDSDEYKLEYFFTYS